ncbi:MAG: hypothetical protein HN919_20895 [Verrucomicrobia bacterium]|jgi:hypothetical protein|nr:hypothetical protein [Verrucomicrobiota bacterium]MBT7068765.1 hypothetical protein [Verrucomicrobiota bacterium]MBT7698866.1 hypothetical protein [Verrucomicrobiota bacterium]
MPDPKPSAAPPRGELKIKRPVGEVRAAKRQVRPRATPRKAPQVNAPTDVGPAFLRILLWAALVGWLLLLAFKLLDPLPFLFPDDDDTGAYAWWRVDPHAPVAAETRDAPAPKQNDPELRALKRRVVTALLSSSFSDALALIERQQKAPDIYPYQDDLDDLHGYVRAVARINAVVADAIRERIDEEVVIRVKDRRVTIIPRASAGDRINAVVIPSGADQKRHSATFSVSDLDPIERSHWIGQADTPHKCAMKLLLHLSAGDPEGARVFAPSCGILARAFEEQLGGAVPITPTTP